DDMRQDKLPSDFKAMRGQNKSLVEAARIQAERYAKQTIETLSPSDLGELKALFSAVLKPIQEAATKAATFWNRTLAFKRARRAGAGFEALTDVEVKAIANGIKTDARFNRLPDLLLQTGKQLFPRPGGNLPTAAAFATKIGQRQAAVRG